jgi:hypothetical protein
MYSTDQLINRANNFLSQYWPEKHVKPVTDNEVKARLTKRFFQVSKQSSSAKAKKSDLKHTEYVNVILYLIAADYLGPKLCVNFKNCKEGCLMWSGHGGNYNCTRGRVLKTLALLLYPSDFRARIQSDAKAAKAKAKKQGKKLVLRLNGTTDLNPKAFGLSEDQNIIRYEYTKCLAYALNQSNSHIHYTYSFYGNESEAVQALKAGINVTVVLRKGQDLPSWAKGYNVINGDDHDLRFLDQSGSIVALTEKTGGFSQSNRRTDLTKLVA